MSVVLPEQDERVNLELFEEFTIPCEVPSFADWDHCGGNPAEWIAYRSVVCDCGIIVRLVCTDCKLDYQWLMAQHAHLYCGKCGADTNGFDRFEPLTRAS
jgi:hypothetical protein